MTDAHEDLLRQLAPQVLSALVRRHGHFETFDDFKRHGGMDDRVEVYGTGGVIYADLFQGNAALTYSEKGYGYAMEFPIQRAWRDTRRRRSAKPLAPAWDAGTGRT